MGLRDEVLNEQTSANNSMERVISQLSEEDASELRDLLLDPLIQGTSIHRVLKSRGFDISERTVQ